MEKLTKRQREALEIIRLFISERGYAPTVRELAERLGTDARAAYEQLLRLERKGFISRDRGKSRAFVPVGRREEGPAPGFKDVPVLRRAPAGGPVPASENVLETVRVDPEWLGAGEFFMLEVRGDSMEGAHITSGDYVIVRVQAWAEQGDIVVALVDGEATVKRFYRRKGYVLLSPDNPSYKPIKAGPGLRIAGKVVGLIRRY